MLARANGQNRLAGAASWVTLVAVPLLLALTLLLAACTGDRGAPECVPDSLVMTTLDSPPAPREIVDSERDALTAIYWATDGPNWFFNNNWLSESPVGSWYGVTTGASGQVIALNLRFNLLKGSIPNEVGELTNLEELNLSFNELSGELPPELGQLANLKCLKVRSDRYVSQLSGQIPAEVANLANLEVLDLGQNALKGLPRELGYLTNLKELRLDDNALGHRYGEPVEIPSELGRLARLEVLDLSGNALRGRIPRRLQNLANLQELNLSSNLLAGISPELGDLVNLRELNLSGNAFGYWERAKIPAELWNLVDLEVLDISWNNLSGALPSEMGNLARLRVLDLRGNQLDGCVTAPLEDQLDARDSHLDGLPYC